MRSFSKWTDSHRAITIRRPAMPCPMWKSQMAKVYTLFLLRRQLEKPILYAHLESLDQPGEAITIRRSRSRPMSLSIAQSLPISMPAPNEQRPSFEQDDEEVCRFFLINISKCIFFLYQIHSSLTYQIHHFTNRIDPFLFAYLCIL